MIRNKPLPGFPSEIKITRWLQVVTTPQFQSRYHSFLNTGLSHMLWTQIHRGPVYSHGIEERLLALTTLEPSTFYIPLNEKGCWQAPSAQQLSWWDIFQLNNLPSEKGQFDKLEPFHGNIMISLKIWMGNYLDVSFSQNTSIRSKCNISVHFV